MTTPTTLRAGDTYSALIPLSDYPATSGWVLKARFTPRATGTAIDITGTAEGADHRLTVAAATTANWPAGAYSAAQWVEKGAEIHTVATGQLTILPNLRTAPAGTDTRSPARQALDAAEAALVAYGAKAYLQQHAIGDRLHRFHTPGEFLAFVSKLRAQVRAEERAERVAQGLSPRNRLLVRFTGR
ncbi:MAG: hypothetical protein J0M00_25230 [Burkholderiales bacterium]|nr:hypothetical protein [Burkholderiales bacterium]